MTELDKLITEATVVRPGDALVIVADAATPQQLDKFMEQIERRLPEGVKAIAISGGVHLYVLRPDGAAE